MYNQFNELCGDLQRQQTNNSLQNIFVQFLHHSCCSPFRLILQVSVEYLAADKSAVAVYNYTGEDALPTTFENGQAEIDGGKNLSVVSYVIGFNTANVISLNIVHRKTYSYLYFY